MKIVCTFSFPTSVCPSFTSACQIPQEISHQIVLQGLLSEASQNFWVQQDIWICKRVCICWNPVWILSLPTPLIPCGCASSFLAPMILCHLFACLPAYAPRYLPFFLGFCTQLHFILLPTCGCTGLKENKRKKISSWIQSVSYTHLTLPTKA